MSGTQNVILSTVTVRISTHRFERSIFSNGYLIFSNHDVKPLTRHTFGTYTTHTHTTSSLHADIKLSFSRGYG